MAWVLEVVSTKSLKELRAQALVERDPRGRCRFLAIASVQ